MTALPEYDRLESTGLWRAAPDDQRVEVIVAIGDATLKITNKADRPLAHWSLPALVRLNPGETPARYAPSDDRDEPEELEVEDEDMIAAIDKVLRAIAKARPREGRVRLILTGGLVLGLGAAAVFWLPQALTRQTLKVVPDVTRAELGLALMERITRVSGAPCVTPLGQKALDRLQARVLGDEGQTYVVRGGVTGAIRLPGHITLVGRTLVEDFEDPATVAGFLLAEDTRAAALDPLQKLLDHAGLGATLRLVTTGGLSDATLDSYAQSLLTAPEQEVDGATLIARFAQARVSVTPYAYALDQSGETTLPLIEADPVPLSVAEPLLPDAAWVSLQGICIG